MPRPIWKGSISFGLVNVPVSLYPAERKKELALHLVDDRNMARVKYERVNEITGEKIPKEQIKRAFELDDGHLVVIEEDDFKRAAAESNQTIEIEDFVDLEDIDYVYYDKPYYLAPGKRAEKGYVLLRETLKRSKKVGIARVVIRTREYLSALVARGDYLILELLRYPQELRNPEELEMPREKPPDYKITDREFDMAQKLVESMSTDWEPEKYRDRYTDELLEWIRQKAQGVTRALPAPKPAESAEVIDITELLKRSVREAQKQRAASREQEKVAVAR